MTKKKTAEQPEQELMSVKDYADACGITVQGIYRRINKGKVGTLLVGTDLFIDAVAFPPLKAQAVGRKPASAQIATK